MNGEEEGIAASAQLSVGITNSDENISTEPESHLVRLSVSKALCLCCVCERGNGNVTVFL